MTRFSPLENCEWVTPQNISATNDIPGHRIESQAVSPVVLRGGEGKGEAGNCLLAPSMIT
ncbi:MAG: hypothetical protein SVY53_03340 [Chloroflexota bacterium]|nr:hypothetical protein [Chloroflexota bacterium]